VARHTHSKDSSRIRGNAGSVHESPDVTLAYLKGKDAESDEAQEYANSSNLVLYA
jgi:hypothetical protein